MKTSLIPALLAITGILSTASADEIRLADGRVIEGEITSTPDSKDVDIRTRSGGMTAVIHLKAADIAKVTYGPTAHQQLLAAFDAHRAALTKSGGTAEQWWSLAEEAKSLGENVAVRQLAQKAIDADGDFAPARTALGFVKQDGKWMKPTEAAVARGEVYFRGKWMQAAQRDGILAEEDRIAKDTADIAAAERATRLAELDLAKKEAELQAAKAAAAAAAMPAPEVIYNSTPGSSFISSSYSSGWGGYFGGGYPGGYYPPTVIYPPVCRPPVAYPPVCRPPIAAPNCGSNFFFGATGQSGNTQWGVGIR